MLHDGFTKAFCFQINHQSHQTLLKQAWWSGSFRLHINVSQPRRPGKRHSRTLALCHLWIFGLAWRRSCSPVRNFFNRSRLILLNFVNCFGFVHFCNACLASRFCTRRKSKIFLVYVSFFMFVKEPTCFKCFFFL